MCVIHEINIRQHVSMTILTKQGGGVICANDPPSRGDLCWGTLKGYTQFLAIDIVDHYRHISRLLTR